jgi:hypothetical protein
VRLYRPFLNVTFHIAIDPNPPFSQLDLTAVRLKTRFGVEAVQVELDDAGESVNVTRVDGVDLSRRSATMTPVTMQRPNIAPTRPSARIRKSRTMGQNG